MKHVMVMSDEKARTGDYLAQCEGCDHALLVEGENVEKGVILFCTKFFDFPVRFVRVKHIPSGPSYSYSLFSWCED